MQAFSPQLHPPWPSPGPAVLCRWANIDFLSLSWPVELRAKHGLLSPSSGRQGRPSTIGPGEQPSCHRGQESTAGLRVRYLSFSLCFLPLPHFQAHVDLFSCSGCPVAAIQHVWVVKNGMGWLSSLRSSGLTLRNLVLALYFSKGSAFSSAKTVW